MCNYLTMQINQYKKPFQSNRPIVVYNVKKLNIISKKREVFMVYGYVRVSTDKQTSKNQKLVIKEYAKLKRLHNIQWIDETISGTKNPDKRKLGKLIEATKEGDIVIITELSGLGRSLMMILEVLQAFLDKKVSVFSIKEGYELGDNIQSKVIAFAFGLSAEIERQLISERTKAGLDRARKQGKQIGRLKGVSPKKYKLTGKGAYIQRMLDNGRSKRSLAIELGVSWITLNRFIKLKRLA